MGLDFKTQGPMVVEFNHSGVVFKNRKAPGFVQLLGGFDDCAFEQVIDDRAVIFDICL